jgi:DNA modification methylase
MKQTKPKPRGQTSAKRKKAPKGRTRSATRKEVMSNDSNQTQPQTSTSRTNQPTGQMNLTRTELVWPGKYRDDGTRKVVPRVSLPFQVIETVNESQATRQAKKASGLTLFDMYEGNEGDTFDTGWTNKLIWGDNLLVMGSLLEKFAGKIDLIYIDPPFATGADFAFTSEIGDDVAEVRKEQSLIEEKAYRDTWGRGLASYLDMMFARLSLIQSFLSERGTLYLHLGRNVSQALKLVCDEVFGDAHFINEITWKRSHAHGDTGQGAQHFGRVTESILVYSKGDDPIWNPQYVPYTDEIIERDYKYVDKKTGEKYRLMPVDGPGGGAKGNPFYEFMGVKGYWRYSEKRMQQLYDAGEIVVSSTGKSLSRKRFLRDAKGTPVTDLWDDVNRISPTSSERLDYPTQKPESLIRRIIDTSSLEGSLVMDVFAGSGTSLAVAEKLGRRWIGCDLSRWAIHTTRKRLLDLEGCRPFEILNLGRYERQYWQGVTFASKNKELSEQSLYEYLAFILKLYGAQPVAGMAHLHGKKGRAMVHIGAVDAPVTIDEINLAIDECAKLKQIELHVLGWEWEMGLYDLMVAEAKKKGVKLLLLQIPREVMEQQAADKGDIQFFELAYLEIDVKTPKKLTATVTLKEFVIPNTELIPEEVRTKVKKWADYVDYWAVDWNFQNDTFLQGWVTYRTRKDRIIALTSDPHTYEQKGKYRVLVKVIDIFGNDTSQAFDVEVK